MNTFTIQRNRVVRKPVGLWVMAWLTGASKDEEPYSYGELCVLHIQYSFCCAHSVFKIFLKDYSMSPRHYFNKRDVLDNLYGFHQQYTLSSYTRLEQQRSNHSQTKYTKFYNLFSLQQASAYLEPKSLFEGTSSAGFAVKKSAGVSETCKISTGLE
jgi:hypothetical protein